MVATTGRLLTPQISRTSAELSWRLHFHRSRLTEDHLSYTANFHHVDGHDHR